MFYLVSRAFLTWLQLGRDLVDRPLSRLAAGGHGPGSSSSSDSPSGMAIASLVLGIASWFALPLIGAIGGAILGKIELNKIERGESPEAGETLAQIGFWASVANIVLGVVTTCVGILIFAVFGFSILSLLGLSAAA